MRYLVIDPICNTGIRCSTKEEALREIEQRMVEAGYSFDEASRMMKGEESDLWDVDLTNGLYEGVEHDEYAFLVELRDDQVRVLTYIDPIGYQRYISTEDDITEVKPEQMYDMCIYTLHESGQVTCVKLS